MHVEKKRDVRSELDGNACEWCADGELQRGSYKGNDAVVCDTCETPAVQLW